MRRSRVRVAVVVAAVTVGCAGVAAPATGADDSSSDPINDAIYDVSRTAAFVGAPRIYTQAQRYADDGLDMRFASRSFANWLWDPYWGGSDESSRSGKFVWDEGKGVSVLALFAHSNAGFMNTEGRSPFSQLIAQWDANFDPVDGGCSPCVTPGPGDAYVSQYVPGIDIDKVRLAIFDGCYTARTDLNGGNLAIAAARNGADAVVAYSGLVTAPVTPSASTDPATTNYYSNYHANRLGYHLKQGDTVETALKRALTDVIAKHGKAHGYDNYRVIGSVARPGAVRLMPAGWGQPGTASPDAGIYWTPTPGVTPFGSISELTPTTSELSETDSGAMRTVNTVQGVEYRLDANGRLYDLSAPTASGGEVSFTLDEASERALKFVERHTEEFDSTWTKAEQSALSHVAGDAIARFVWRPVLAKHPGPRVVTVEIDRRTGAVTYYSDVRARGWTEEFRVSGQEAIEAVRSATGAPAEAGEASAVPDTWHYSRWIVTVDHGFRSVGGRAVPHVDTAVVDARTGQVQQIGRS